MSAGADSAKATRPTLCIGAAHWDVIGRTPHALPPGADVPGRVIRRPGGVARNVAVALARLGAPVSLIAAIGRDAPGAAIVADLEAAGVDCRGLHRVATTDLYVAIETAKGELHVAVADCTSLERSGLALLAPLRDGTLAAPDSPWPGAVVLDGNLPAAILAAALADPTLPGPIAIVPASPEKSAGLAPLLGRRPVTLYLNRHEAETLCRTTFTDSRAAALAVAALAGSAVVTDGAAPASAAAGASLVTRTPPAVAARSVTGAGDVFVAAHLAACAEGCDAGAALDRAIAAAAHHVTREDP